MQHSRGTCEFGTGACKRQECPCDLWYERTESRKMLAELLEVESGLTNWEIGTIERLARETVLTKRDCEIIGEIYNRRL